MYYDVFPSCDRVFMQLQFWLSYFWGCGRCSALTIISLKFDLTSFDLVNVR